MLQQLILLAGGTLMIAAFVAAIGCALTMARGRFTLKSNLVLHDGRARIAAACGGLLALAFFLLGAWAFSTEFKILQRNVEEVTERQRRAEAQAALRDANMKMLTGQLEDAISAYDQAMQFDLTSGEQADMFNLRGVAFYELGEFASAERDFKWALDVVPAHGGALRNLAWLYATCSDKHFRSGREALTHVNEALETAQQPDGDLYMVLAAAYAETGDFPAALEAHERAMQLAAEGQASVWDHYQAVKQWRSYEKGRPFRWPMDE